MRNSLPQGVKRLAAIHRSTRERTPPALSACCPAFYFDPIDVDLVEIERTIKWVHAIADFR
jgi:hypothetical protein